MATIKKQVVPPEETDSWAYSYSGDETSFSHKCMCQDELGKTLEVNSGAAEKVICSPTETIKIIPHDHFIRMEICGECTRKQGIYLNLSLNEACELMATLATAIEEAGQGKLLTKNR